MIKSLWTIAIVCLPLAAMAQDATAPADEVTDEERCTELQAFAERVNPTLPTALDNVVEVFRVSVDCETKSVQYEKRLNVDRRSVPPGFAERQLAEHRAIHCGPEGLARLHGWTAIDVYFDATASRLATLVASPADCPETDGG
ncbi:MAG: hypothetical protein AAFV38_15565 [Pseudomonadota bacterium]